MNQVHKKNRAGLASKYKELYMCTIPVKTKFQRFNALISVLLGEKNKD